MAIETALAVAGALTSVVSSITRGRRQRRLAEERAREKERQRQEIARRTESEIRLLSDAADQAVGLGQTQYAGAGIDVSSGASVQAMMESYENLGRTVMNKQYEAAFRMSQLSLEERWERKQGDAMQSASIIDAFGSIMETGVNMFKASGYGRVTNDMSLSFGTPIDGGANNFNFSGSV